MRDFLEKHFDKLFLGMMFLGGCGFLIWIYCHANSHSQWAENAIGQILAALLTLMTGARLAQRGSDNGGTNGKTNGTTPSGPVALPTLTDSGVRSDQGQPKSNPSANVGG